MSHPGVELCHCRLRLVHTYEDGFTRNMCEPCSSVRCDLGGGCPPAPAATPGRDELREQIAAIREKHYEVQSQDYRQVCATCSQMRTEPYYNEERSWREGADWPCAAITAASVVDTWVAAHTEQGAEDEQVAALRAEVEQMVAWARQEEAIADEAEATVARVRALCDKWSADPWGRDDMAAALRAALDPPTEGQ